MEDRGKAANTLVILNSNNKTGNSVCVCLKDVFPGDFLFAMHDYRSTGG